MVLLLSGNKAICKGQYYDHDEAEIGEGEKISVMPAGSVYRCGIGGTRATIGGVIEQYHIPLSEWTSSMYAIQSAMIFVYSLVFTILLAIPLGIYFLGGDE